MTDIHYVNQTDNGTNLILGLVAVALIGFLIYFFMFRTDVANDGADINVNLEDRSAPTTTTPDTTTTSP